MKYQSPTQLVLLTLAVLLVLPGTSVYGLYVTKMPQEMQTKSKVPVERAVSLKLPLHQAVFHWTFLNKQELLAGSLTLRISRAGKTEEIVVFKGGKISEGWKPVELPHAPGNTRAGEIYFGFQSSSKYATAPGDQLELELEIKSDLEGIGPTETGVLPKGKYTTKGTYSGLIDEYKLPEAMAKSLSEETIRKLREMYEFKAFLENWDDQWDLRITSGDGWLPPDQAHRAREAVERLDREQKSLIR